MKSKIKNIIKKAMVFVGLRHPAKGVKVSQARKAEILLDYKTPAMNVLIETGTHQGGMITALKKHFKEVYSIELDREIYEAAISKFSNEENVHLRYGDSAKEIHKILVNIAEPALIWLDTHASGLIDFNNSPIEFELRAIFNHPVKNFIILVDDARLFSVSDIRKIKRMAGANNYRCVIDEGIFKITPRV